MFPKSRCENPTNEWFSRSSGRHVAICAKREKRHEGRSSGTLRFAGRVFPLMFGAKLDLRIANSFLNGLRGPGILPSRNDQMWRTGRVAYFRGSFATAAHRVNVVIRDVRDNSGMKLGTVVETHDSTEAGVIRSAKRATARMYAEYPGASNIESRIGATDATGRPKWSVSPNFQHIAEIGTDEASYIWGSVGPKCNLKERRNFK